MAPELNALGPERRARRERAQEPLVFIGFMGAGKTTAARALARASGWRRWTATRCSSSASAPRCRRCSTRDGEAAFRDAEEQIVLELLRAPGRRRASRSAAARSCRGGARSAGAPSRGLARRRPESGLGALPGRRPPAGRRPGALRRPARRARAPLCRAGRRRSCRARARMRWPTCWRRPRACAPGTRLIWATSASGDYPVYIGPGLLERRLLARGGHRAGASWSPTATSGACIARPLAPLCGAGDDHAGRAVQDGRPRRDRLDRAGARRPDPRGPRRRPGRRSGRRPGRLLRRHLPARRALVQVPTTLVAQVDSAYGGKTGVDLAGGQELRRRLSPAQRGDLPTPRRWPRCRRAELAAGYAEVVKTALIAGGSLWERVRAGADPATPEMIPPARGRSCGSSPPTSATAGLRQVLNLGHTVGARDRDRDRLLRATATARRSAWACSPRCGSPSSDELRAEVAELLARPRPADAR